MSRANHILGKFPSFYRKDDGVATNLQQLIQPFGDMIDQAEEDLLKVMRSHFVNKANNEGSEGLDTSNKGDLDYILSLYLQHLGGTSMLKQSKHGEDGDREYRIRSIGLINALMGGASTIAGIHQIVAANLGLEAGNPTLERIEIKEFFPEFVRYPQYTLATNETFELHNENDIPVSPEFRIHVSVGFFADLKDVGLRREDTGEVIQFYGIIRRKSTLVIQTDGKAFVDGTPISYKGKLSQLPPGKTKWKFIAQLAPLVSRFNEDAYNTAIFSEAGSREPGTFDDTMFDNSYFLEDNPKPAGVFGKTNFGESIFQHGLRAVFLTYGYVKLQPAAFTVSIPWDITEETGKIREPSSEVRSRISYIVNKVKAAGVVTEVSYKKEFVVDQQLADHLDISTVWQEVQELEELPLRHKASNEQQVMKQDMEDNLLLGGVFDHTSFDSLNKFY